MVKTYQKRTNILDIIDRLHVEKTIYSNSEEKLTFKENPLKHVVNPILLDDSKSTVLTVQPGTNGKVKHRVYMLRRSRTTEGGSLVCELCGNLSFKLYSTAIEITEGGRRDSQSRTQTEVVKVCRVCFGEHNGGNSGCQKTGRKTTARPAFDRSTLGVTHGRASNSWHFLRRDVVKAKTKLLKSRECFENDFAETHLSGQSSDSSGDSFPSSEDDNTSYEESDSDESCHSLEQIHKIDVFKQPSPLVEMNNELTLDMLMENELTITRSTSAQISPASPKVLNKSDIPGEISNSKNISTMLHDFEQPIEVVKENVDVTSGLRSRLVDGLLDNELFDYFMKTPGRFKKLRVRNSRTKRLGTDTKKPIVPVKSGANNYKGVCRLVTVLNRRRGSYFDNSTSTRLFDTSGNEWRKQDLPNFIGINTTKYTEGKQSYRQLKKDIDYFMTNSKPKRVMKYKSDVECSQTEMIQNDNSLTNLKELSEVDSAALDVSKESKTADHSHAKHSIDEEKIRDIRPTLVAVDVIKTVEKKKSELATKSQDSPVRGRSNHHCIVCTVPLYKSYHVFNKDNTPLVLLKYFKQKSSIQICRSCLKANTPKRASPNEKPKKKVRQENEKEDIAPLKLLKPDPRVREKSTASKNPPQKSSPTSKRLSYTIKQEETPDQLTKLLHKNASETKDASQINILQNTDQLSKVSDNRYVIVKSKGKSVVSSVQNNSSGSSITSGNGSDILINGKRYKIDTEFNLNELLKDNENASMNLDTNNKEILSHLPSILKHTAGNNRMANNAALVKIAPKRYSSIGDVNKRLNIKTCAGTKVNQQTTAATNEIIQKFNKNTIPSATTKHSVTVSSLPSITLQIQEQIRRKGSKTSSATNETKVLHAQIPSVQLSNTSSASNMRMRMPTTNMSGPVKPIQLIQPPKTTSPLKRPMYGSPLNTPMPPKKRQNTSLVSSSNSKYSSHVTDSSSPPIVQ